MSSAASMPRLARGQDLRMSGTDLLTVALACLERTWRRKDWGGLTTVGSVRPIAVQQGPAVRDDSLASVEHESAWRTRRGGNAMAASGGGWGRGTGVEGEEGRKVVVRHAIMVTKRGMWLPQLNVCTVSRDSTLLTLCKTELVWPRHRSVFFFYLCYVKDPFFPRWNLCNDIGGGHASRRALTTTSLGG